MVGIYDTAVLTRVVESLITPQTFFLDRFFPMEVTADEETIVFDVMNGKRRMAPFVSPVVAGKVVASQGFTTNSLKPAYVKDKRILRPGTALKRRAGERIGGAMSPALRQQANLATEMQDQIEMLTRRLEWMGARAMAAGKYTITGEGFPDTEINFARHSSLTDTLTSTARWGETGVSPYDYLDAKANLMLKMSGAVVTDVVMTPDAWALYMADPKVAKALDTTIRGGDSRVNLGHDVRTGAVWKGRIGTWDMWVYNDWYVDDAGSEQAVLPDYTVIMASTALEGVRHFGAIQDEKAGGLQAMKFFTKSWLEEDPPVRWLLMQSAPLVVPYRPNASFSATVR